MAAEAYDVRPTIFRESGLIVVFLATLVYVGIVFLTPGSPVRVPFGYFELVFAPGYALGALLFLRRPQIPPVAEFAVAVGLSVVYNVLVGLTLALLGVGLLIDWFLLAEIVVVALALAAKLLAGPSAGVTGAGSLLRREFRLPGVRPEYRRAVYVLFLATVVAIVAVVYLSVIQPPTSPSTSLALSGPGGTAASLPTSLRVGEVGLAVVFVANGHSGAPIELVVTALFQGESPTSNLTAVPWSLPLTLANGTVSSLPLGLAYGQTTTLNVTFAFGETGAFSLGFDLEASGGSLLPPASLNLAVTS